jgi:hypothetical protein
MGPKTRKENSTTTARERVDPRAPAARVSSSPAAQEKRTPMENPTNGTM